MSKIWTIEISLQSRPKAAHSRYKPRANRAIKSGFHGLKPAQMFDFWRICVDVVS